MRRWIVPGLIILGVIYARELAEMWRLAMYWLVQIVTLP